jgi:hypothetical protein
VLVTNDVINGHAVSVRIDLETGETKAFAGPGYHVAPDGSSVVGFPLELMHVTQGGYGMPAADHANPPKLPPGAAKDEGTWRTDLRTNEKRLVCSLADAAGLITELAPREGGTFYFWHAKFNRQGTRVMQILRCMFPDGFGDRNPMVVTFKPDGSELRMCPFKPVWGAGGGHSNWHGDGEHIVRHVKVGDAHRFVMSRFDADEMIVLCPSIEASGHPSVEPTGRFLITDDHPQIGKSQHVILRFIDLKSEKETLICKLPTVFRPALSTIDLRLDGHPVWSRDYQQCSLQALGSGGHRGLFIVDLAELMG